MTPSVDELVQVGVSHVEAPIELLERVSVRGGDGPRLLAEVMELGATEAVLLSTCSRTEVYYVRPGPDPADVTALLARHAGLASGPFHAVARVRTGASALEHLLRVTSGLDARVVGEVDVQQQVRSAYRTARTAGTLGPLLDRVLPLALRNGDEARARTSLGRLGRSLAHRAVDIGMSSAPGPGAPHALVVGSGQMAVTAIERLTALGVLFRVAARDELYAARLAGAARVCSLTALVAGIRRADLLVCATSASSPVVTVEQVREAMVGRSRPLTVVDLAVPRNVDPAAAALDLVTLVDLSGLNDDAAGDPGVRDAVGQAEDLVRAAARGYVEDERARRAGPLINAARTQLRDSGRPDLLHEVTMAARAAAVADDAATLRSLCEAFGVPSVEVGLDPVAEALP